MKALKINLLLALAAGALLAFAPTGRAEDQKARNSSGDRERRGDFMKQRLDKMAEDLKLTEDQKKKIQEVFKSQGEKMRELRDATPEERREKGRAMREEFDKKIKEILTSEQYEKWQKSRQERGPGGPEGKKREKKSKN